MLEWYLSTMCYLTLQEVVERRTELFKIINGDVFSPLKEWPLALRFWTKPLSDEDSFKMMLFLIGNGLAPRLAAEWVMLSQFWTRDHEKMKQRVIQADFVLTNLESKKKPLVVWLTRRVNHAMPSPKIFILAFVTVNSVVVTWFTIVEERLQSRLCPAKGLFI